MNEPSHSRHLTREGLLEYLAAEVPSVVRLDGDPVGFLVIEPAGPTIAIRFPRTAGQIPDLEPFRYFASSAVAWDGENWVEIAVIAEADLSEAYPVLCAVADRVQLDGMAVHEAAIDALQTYRELLAGLDRLSDDEEVGLFGELLVLRHLVGSVGAGIAVKAWRGPSAEEHDFSLSNADVEVKSSTSEVRRHWINDVSQLVPTPNRALWLLSIQLTTGGVDAVTLPAMVDATRALLDNESLGTFETGLEKSHWRSSHAVLYRRAFRLRSKPGTFLVDGGFPAITPGALKSAGLDPVRFPKVKYLLDLAGIPAADAPFNLSSIEMGDLH